MEEDKEFFVYVLLSRMRPRTYVGQCQDVDERFVLHNAGRVRSTKSFRPWSLIHREVFQTRAEAIRREKWLKGRQGRQFIAELIHRQKA